MSDKLAALRRCQVPPVLLAILLQLAPAIHWFSQQLAQPSGVIAIVIKIGGVSAALLGGIQSTSGATTWVSSTNPPAGRVGTAFTYRLQTSGNETAQAWSSSPLPAGLAITGSGTTFFVQGTPTTAGTNSVTLTGWEIANKTGASVSGTAVFRFTNAPPAGTAPAITTPPRSQRRIPGTNAVFTVTATGTAPLAYQWRKAATNLSGETNSSLSLSNCSPADAGAYVVVVTNGFGSITSAPANLLIAGRPEITNSLIASGLRFQFAGETGVTYRVESSQTVEFGSWTAVTNITPAQDGLITVTNAPASATNTFFRLRLLSP